MNRRDFMKSACLGLVATQIPLPESKPDIHEIARRERQRIAEEMDVKAFYEAFIYQQRNGIGYIPVKWSTTPFYL